MFDFTKIALYVVAALIVYDHIKPYLTIPAFITNAIASVTHAAREVASVPSRIARAFTGIFTGFASGWKSVSVAPVSAVATNKPISGLPAFNLTNPTGTPAITAPLPGSVSATTANLHQS